ncbi:MAG: hypothetical protein V3U02_03035 [Calditrichia bacterium]
MNPSKFDFINKDVLNLAKSPFDVVEGEANGNHYKLSFSIPNYRTQLTNYFSEHINAGLDAICQAAATSFNFTHFGVICEFDKQIEIHLHDDNMNLDNSIRMLVNMYGPVLLKKVYLKSEQRTMGHRNRFPHLNFHRDRDFTSPSTYSVFTRDPFDPEQAEPRRASTLVIPNLTAYLQSISEDKHEFVNRDGGRLSRYDIFKHIDVDDLIGKIILELPWGEPHGTGEISILDNCDVLHASYYECPELKAYRIGVRYLH